MEQVSFKGTPFHTCEIPYDVFHMQRRTKLTIKQYLSKMGFLMLRDGTLEVKGDSKPEIKDVEEILLEMASQFEMSSTFKKPDYFVPMTVVEGLASSANMLKRGIQIHCLQSRLIYPLYGVWTPTTQEYLSLLSNYVSQKTSHYSRFKNMVDLGCGTGVLSIVLCENGGFGGQIYSIDS